MSTMRPCAKCRRLIYAGIAHTCPDASCFYHVPLRNPAPIDAHLAQPAQAVGVGAIRDVIEQMRKASAQRAMPPHYEAGCYMAWIDDLTRALSGEKAWPAGDRWLPIETAPKDGREMILLLTPSRFPQVTYSNTWWTAGFSVECNPTHWMRLEPLPASPAPDKEG